MQEVSVDGYYVGQRRILSIIIIIIALVIFHYYL